MSSVLVTGAVYGPAGRVRVRMAVDTGATRTVIRASVLEHAGYTLAPAAEVVWMTSATGVVMVPLVYVFRLDALRRSAPVSAAGYELPRTFEEHGLLGRDFFRGHVLTIDFVRSEITLRPPRRGWRFWR